MKYIFLVFIVFIFTCTDLVAQKGQPLKVPGYKFIKRVKGPKHKGSKVLEIAIDKYNNYFVATFEAEKSRFTYVGIYRLYTWEQIGMYRLEVKRAELYASVFDPEGNYFYVNTDIYKNQFKKIDLKTGEITEANCSETPNNCKKIEPELYQIEAYTIGENYYIFRDIKLKNYIRIFVKKELYIPGMESEGGLLGQVIKENKEIILSAEEITTLKNLKKYIMSEATLIYIDSLAPEQGSKNNQPGISQKPIENNINGGLTIQQPLQNTVIKLYSNDIMLLTNQGFIVVNGTKISIKKNVSPAQNRLVPTQENAPVLIGPSDK